MPRRTTTDPPARRPDGLSRDGIVASAIELADRDGMEALSMRGLARELGVDPMSLYYHLRDKGALLAAVTDAVVAEIPVAPVSSDAPWTAELRTLILSARRTMLDHPWAVGLFEGRPTPTPAVLAHIDRVLGILRRGGCSLDLTHHALHVLGSRILGFSQDLFDDAPRDAPPVSAAQVQTWAQTLPHVAELAGAVSHTGGLGGCDDDAEFSFSLDLILDGLERRRLAE